MGTSDVIQLCLKHGLIRVSAWVLVLQEIRSPGDRNIPFAPLKWYPGRG